MEAIENYKKEIDKIINQTFDKLNSESNDLQIIFPPYSSHEHEDQGNRIRISEQELRFALVEQFLGTIKSKGWHYSVETPTKFYYRSARNGNEPSLGGSRSGKIDLTLYDENKNPIAFFEFKSGSLSQNDNSGKCNRELKYDIIKLIVESRKYDCLGYSLHIMEKANNKITNFNDYIKEAINRIKDTKDDSKEKNNIEEIENKIFDRSTVCKEIQYRPLVICKSLSTAE